MTRDKERLSQPGYGARLAEANGDFAAAAHLWRKAARDLRIAGEGTGGYIPGGGGRYGFYRRQYERCRELAARKGTTR